MYKVILTPNAQIVRVSDGVEEVIKHPYFSVKKAESIIRLLNLGHKLDFDELLN